MNIIKTNFNPQIPLSLIEEFVVETIGWEKGSFAVMLLMFPDREEFVYVNYPTDLNGHQAELWMGAFDVDVELFNDENKRHQTIDADTKVNGGALKLALNALRRAGKDEIANELEKTAERIN